jgi:hypothetical protein
MKIITQKVVQKTILYESSHGDDEAFITITEWANLEGHDIEICAPKRPEQRFSLTWEEWSALSAVMAAMNLRSTKE